MTYNPGQHPQAVALINKEAGLPIKHQFGRAYLRCHNPEKDGTPDPNAAFNHLDFHNKGDAPEDELVDLITRWKENYVGAALDLILGG